MKAKLTWAIRPFDPECQEFVPVDDGVAEAIRCVVADWDGTNWAIVHENLRHLGRTPDEIRAMTLDRVRAAFDAGQRPLLLKLGEQRTAVHEIFWTDADSADVSISLPPPIIVDKDNDTVTYEGTQHPLTPDQTDFIAALVNARGGWVPGKAMGLDASTRTDRLKKRLPEPIKAVIESKPGTGSRLNLPF